MRRCSGTWWSVVALVASQACRESPTVYNPDQQLPSPVNLMTVSIPGGGLGGGVLTPVDNHTSIQITGVATMPRTTLVRFQAGGTIKAYTNFNLPPSVVAGEWGPDGIGAQGCTGNVYLAASISGGFAFCYPPGTAKDFDVALLVKGTVGVGWNAGPSEWRPPECGGGIAPCYLFTDATSFTWSLEKIAATADVVPDRKIVQPGGQVTFTAFITPPQYDGVSMPIEFPDYWYYKPDGGSVVPVCVPGSVCIVTPPSTGTVSVVVFAQGDSLRFTGRVVVNPCPPVGDSLADDPEIRKQMFAEMDTARAGLPWKERGGHFSMTPAGPIHDYKSINDALNTDCHTDLDSPSTGYPVKAIWHLHTVGVGDYWVTCDKVPALTEKLFEDYASIDPDAQRYALLAPDFPGLESWILSAGGILYKLDATHNTWQTATRFKFNMNDPNHCMTSVP